MNSENRYPIKVVSQKTGLSLHVIRAWEKRYHVVSPQRTDTNRRLYTDDDVYRLELLKKTTENGYSIGNVADLPVGKLEELAEKKSQSAEGHYNIQQFNRMDADPDIHYEKCIQAVYNFNSTQLRSALDQASVSLTQPVLIQFVIIPLVTKIGELWRKGSLRVMHEHMASAVLKTFLANLRNAFRPSSHAPAVVVATPKGQFHEIGALIVALAAAAEGWRVVYLGTDLPSEEIAAACIQKEAKAIVLSIVYPADDAFLYHELENLKNLLPENIKIMVGGRVSLNYKRVLEKISAWSSDDLDDFRNYLEKIEKY